MRKFYLSCTIILIVFKSFSQTTPEVSAVISNYQTRIAQNGGSISSSDLAVVADFVTAAKSHQYWDKLIDVGSLAGDNISAALTKLKYPANGVSVLENTGFSGADYAGDQGFQLNYSKSLNTKANLSALNLSGRFGFSMWLSDGGTAWMGSANNATPYSLLYVQPTSVISYIGTPPSYTAVSGAVPSSKDGFYYVKKQSVDSIKIFVDGNQVGKSRLASSTTSLRNADVQVFKEASSVGKGLFYCIDDGTLTDADAKELYEDVKALLYGLGRKVPQEVKDIINNYKTRIIQNGGSISSNDSTAVADFVAAAKYHQYWDKLVDVGPLAGTNVSAALTKLKYPAKGVSILENTGFLNADYTGDQGFRLNPVKSLNTKTNLSALSLSGRFGFSMWLSDGGTAWMGSANNATPYSLLYVQPTSMSAYAGTPPANTTVSGAVPSSKDGFYYVKKQSVDSIKVFVDGSQVGKSRLSSSTTSLRNADVQVFKEAGSVGKGLFYCIDDGTLTDADAKELYEDVKALLYGLGRKAPQEVSDIIGNYQARIIQNGGSINSNDLAAVTNFVAAAKYHQYWDKLVDVGPLAGTNVNAALTKLKYPANGVALLQNTGFAAGDYAADQGFLLNYSKSLNTKTNLSTLSLSGRFGFSMWLSDGGTAWMGSANNATPYSLLYVQPTSMSAYIGTPPSYAAVSGAVSSSKEGFYYIKKQSSDSIQIFIDGNQIGKSFGSATSSLRNADVQVFKEGSSTGTGLFYSIDNGTMTNSEVTQFYDDVTELMYELERKAASPEISAKGLYTQAQNVSISQTMPDLSSKKTKIYYTIDGTTPTTASPVYSSPLTVTSTTRIQAIAVKNGRVSKQADSWVAVVPAGFSTTKYYSAHVMVNLLSFTNNMDAWLNEMKASGYNLIWAHLDDYTGSYVTTLKSLMEAANRVGGIQVIPGTSWWVNPLYIVQMFKDTWNYPALFKIGGKRVYTGWDYQPGSQAVIDALLNLSNISTNQYYMWAHSRYPYSYDDGNTWVGEYTSNSYVNWGNTSSSAARVGDVDHLYQMRPQLDGLINFAVDQGGDTKAIIRTNKLITQSSIQRGKFSMAGVSAFYASVSFADFGFKGATEIWDSVLALPVGSRPSAMGDITANDYAELSYISPLVIPPTKGISFVPPLGSGFTLGDNIRHPVLDHSGIQKFLRPWVDAFLNNQTAPVFPEDRIFAWYWLHPKDQAPNPVLPATFSGYAYLNQQWWNNTVYASGNIMVGGLNQVAYMKYNLGTGMNKIRMAAHLKAPAQLKINNTLSAIMPAGPAYFEIDMGTFRGTPTFSIVRSNAEVKKGDGLQPIVNNVFPGGWNFLATEILPAATGTSNFVAGQPSSTDSFTANASAPVTVNSITAYGQDSKINVDWTVKTDPAIDKYEVEKLSGDYEFTKVATVSAKANGSLTSSHSWVDVDPKKDNNSYRIKVISKDGTIAYTKIVNVRLSDAKERFNIYPNPVTGANLTIQFDDVARGLYTVELVAANGQKVSVRTINHPGGSVSQTIPIDAALPKGIYSLQITGAATRFSKQIFK